MSVGQIAITVRITQLVTTPSDHLLVHAMKDSPAMD